MKHLGDYVMTRESFPQFEGAFKEFLSSSFQTLAEQQKVDQVCRTLLKFIEEAPADSFLLSGVLGFIEKIHRENILDHFHFNHFEFWLNQFSGLSPQDNYRIRGKVAGRFIPRNEYQLLFPIGGEKVYDGSHFVTAHTSPDLDTTVASFWGWLDAFAARVSEGLHVWNIPGGRPPAQTEVSFLFYNVFGHDIFNHLAKHRTALSVSGLDLVTQEGVVKKEPQDSVFDVDHENGYQAVVLVDERGRYIGEWRSTDVDRVRSVINLLNQCLRWYENSLHVKLISIFAIEKLTQKELKAFFENMLSLRIEEYEPAREFTLKQRALVDDYLRRVLGVEEGLKSSFFHFTNRMSRHGISPFQEFTSLLESPSLFDSEGKLIENRSDLFHYLAKVIGALENAVYTVRLYVDKFEVALKVKSKVLDLMPHHVNYRADLDEIRSKIDSFPYLTVTSSDREGNTYPLGVIHATDLFKTSLGTVSLRDFSNREETKVPSYLEVISIIDHHKSHISSSAPTVTWITDAQSSNALVAELSFQMTDRYGTGGMSLEQIEKQIEHVQKSLKTPSDMRILQRLLQKHMAAKRKGNYFIAPDRERIEYLHYLYAILDDTDLLSKAFTKPFKCSTATSVDGIQNQSSS